MPVYEGSPVIPSILRSLSEEGLLVCPGLNFVIFFCGPTGI